MASFMLAIVALTICLMFCTRGYAYASARDDVTSFDSAGDQGTTSKNYNDGLWLTWGN